MDGIYCAQFIFYNDFDSANLLKVEFVSYSESVVVKQASSSSANKNIVAVDIPDAEFNIWTKPDCYGTEFENGNRTWFYYGVKAPKPGLLVKFNIIDLNKQGKMYSQGMAPVYRVIPGKYKWERIHDKPVYGTVDEVFTLSFKYRTPENLESITYFAFTYPFSYSELQKMLCNVDAKWLSIQPITEDDIYYARETACVSLEGRNIDLITISSYHGITMEREDRLRNLFLDKNVARPHTFPGKKVIFISARVHPGETPSSFVFNGILKFLLSRDDLQAQLLRKTYVFKLIPFLNPDGVANGHYRTDTRGVNLNRVYLDPNFKEHPSVYAARALIRYYHFGAEKEDKVPKCEACISDPEGCRKLHANDSENINKMSHMSLNEHDSEHQVGSVPWCTKWHNFCRQCGCKLTHTESKEEVKFEAVTVGNRGDVNCNESGLYLYLDLHGHASKKGIFIYGNHFDDLERRVECMLFPKLMGLNNHHFHFQGCNFTERNMYLRDKRDGMSRAGSGRVAVLSLTGMIKSYTLECNYNTGRLVNVLPPTVKESSGKVHTLPVPPKYTPQIFEEVGRSLGASILDLSGQNPFSRLPNSEFHNLNGLRDWLRNSCSTNNFGESRPKLSKMRPPAVAQNQGKNRTIAIQRVRPVVRKTMKQYGKSRGPLPIDCKVNLVCHPSLTHSSSSKSSLKLNRTFKSKSRKEISNLKSKNTTDILNQATTARRKKMPITVTSQKLKVNLSPTEKESKGEEEELRLREICFMKSTEGGKTMIAKYKNKEGEGFDDTLVVSWDAPSSKATVFTHRSKLPAPVFLPKSSSEPGSSKQRVFRIHNFSKSASFKTRLNKQGLRRLVSASELGKMEKKKKKLRLK